MAKFKVGDWVVFHSPENLLPWQGQINEGVRQIKECRRAIMKNSTWYTFKGPDIYAGAYEEDLTPAKWAIGRVWKALKGE